MTPTQLNNLEAKLEKRGYKKWTKFLVGHENFMWAKSFGVHKDKCGEDECNYQIAFRVYDLRKYQNLNALDEAQIGLTVTMIGSSFNNRLDVDYSMQLDAPDVEMCERMMDNFYETAKKYLK